MSYIMVDVESDGPIPGEYSMVSLGMVVVEPSLSKTFYGEIYPISEKWDPEALAISGHSREKTLTFTKPELVMAKAAAWVKENSVDRPIFISDNNGYDWMFTCFYFHKFTGSNPFGYSSQNLNSMYKGLVRDAWASFKKLRKTVHDHHPVNDAKGNAEALLALQRDYGLNIKLV